MGGARVQDSIALRRDAPLSRLPKIYERSPGSSMTVSKTWKQLYLCGTSTRPSFATIRSVVYVDQPSGFASNTLPFAS
jgi:hypothetical protein